MTTKETTYGKRIGKPVDGHLAGPVE